MRAGAITADFNTEIVESLPDAGFLSRPAQPETLSAEKSALARNSGRHSMPGVDDVIGVSSG